MKTIATLGPSVRLVVFQFLMKSAQVPAVIPPKRVSKTPPLPPVSGVEVLKSTSSVCLTDFLEGINWPGTEKSSYKLVDVWFMPAPYHFGKSMVRYIFCHRNHVKTGELHPDFVANRDKLFQPLHDFIANNLWAVQAHLNPYFEKDGSPTDDKVLMFGCAGRVPDTEIFSGGRDKNGQGMGPKVLRSTLSPKLTLTKNKVVLIVK